MNNHSNRFGVVLVVAGLLAGACGGGDSGGGNAANKGDWEKKYGAIVKSVSDDIDRSTQALNAGQQPVVRSECGQLQEDLVEARKAVPVPDGTVDAALRSAFDATDTAAKTCAEGARVATNAGLVEQAQREMKTARTTYNAAQDAIAAWD
jgi:cobalamin biosynthesis protein CobT